MYAEVGDFMNNFEIIHLLNLLYDKTREAKVDISLCCLKNGLIIDKMNKKCHNINVRDW